MSASALPCEGQPSLKAQLREFRDRIPRVSGLPRRRQSDLPQSHRSHSQNGRSVPLYRTRVPPGDRDSKSGWTNPEIVLHKEGVVVAKIRPCGIDVNWPVVGSPSRNDARS